VIGDHRNVDLRKNLRNWLPPPEHGEKCSMCGERQEISGMGMGSFESRGKMREWWTDLAKKINGKTGLHLRMDENDQCDERLCAVCLTKRLFPLVAEQAIGWKMPINFPSVSYMASVEWLKTCFDRAPVEAARFAETAGGVGVDKSETKTRLRGLSGKLKKRIDQIKGVAGRQGWLSDWHDFVDLDGSACFKDAIRSKDFGLNETEQKELIGALEKLQQAAGASASPFYALLGMDGDSMGALLSNCTDEERQAVSEGIMTFSRKVPGIVDEHDGWLIYAGGEDVLAFLPLDSALACTVDLRQCYRGTFTDPRLSIRAFQRDAATISAAINFVHIHTSLQVAVRDTHKLLKEYAKEHMGRDALACRVWKRGGPILTWAIPWEHALAIQIELIEFRINNGYRTHARKCFKYRLSRETFISITYAKLNKFFYKLEDLFELLPSLDDQQMVDLLTAEYLANRELAWPDKDISEAKKREEARKRIARLLALCKEKRRKAERNAQGELAVSYGSGGFRADGALLVRFLVQKGLEK
jgi:CRISPR-associated protein Cmr2